MKRCKARIIGKRNYKSPKTIVVWIETSDNKKKWIVGKEKLTAGNWKYYRIAYKYIY